MNGQSSKRRRAGMYSSLASTLVLLACGVLAVPAAAQEAYDANADAPVELQGPGMIVELGAGATLQPSYEGSSRYIVTPFPTVRLEHLRLSNGFEFGGDDDLGLSFHPSFRYRSDRSASDDSDLRGLPDVDSSIELGGGVAYEFRYLRAFVDLRYGITGHNGFVGETGIDVIAHPTDRLTFWLGPRVSFADDQYMDTYFSVSPAASVASGLPRYSASGGFKSVGVEANARFQIDERWAVESTAGWNRLISDAGESPITALGNDDQFIFKLGFVRKFLINF